VSTVVVRISKYHSTNNEYYAVYKRSTEYYVLNYICNKKRTISTRHENVCTKRIEKNDVLGPVWQETQKGLRNPNVTVEKRWLGVLY
jgi:hypothetical protein